MEGRRVPWTHSKVGALLFWHEVWGTGLGKCKRIMRRADRRYLNREMRKELLDYGEDIWA